MRAQSEFEAAWDNQPDQPASYRNDHVEKGVAWAWYARGRSDGTASFRRAADDLCQRLRKYERDFDGAWMSAEWWADELEALEKEIAK